MQRAKLAQACVRATAERKSGANKAVSQNGVRVSNTDLLYFLFSLNATTLLLPYNLNYIYERLVVVRKAKSYLSCTKQQ